MKERTFFFGENNSLLGIITDPLPGSCSPNQTAIILLNAGVVPRFGPNRIYVTLARALAYDGFTVLRFDFSGIGDSNVSQTPRPLEERAVIETREAMDFLNKTRGVERFVLMGICSGADNAFRVARCDRRVAGVVMIEGYSFQTFGHRFRSYIRHLLHYESWLRLISGKSQIWRLVPSMVVKKFRRLKSKTEEPPLFVLPTKEQFITGLWELGKQGISLCFIYTASGAAYSNYQRDLKEDLKKMCLNGIMQIETIDNSDHVFTPLSAQQSLVTTVSQWIKKTVPLRIA